MSRRREIAIFACGAQTFHTLVHGLLWASGTRLKLFGFKLDPADHGWAALANAVIAIGLGFAAWGEPKEMLERGREVVSRVRRLQPRVTEGEQVGV